LRSSSDWWGFSFCDADFNCRDSSPFPGPDPFLSLAEALFADAALGPELRQGTFRTIELLAKQLKGDIDTALAPLRDGLDQAAERRRAGANYAKARPARLALAADQAESLFIEAEARSTTAFAELLSELVRQKLAFLIFTLRSDAYAQFQSIEALVSLCEAPVTVMIQRASVMVLNARTRGISNFFDMADRYP
jgi:hypothetical protein